MFNDTVATDPEKTTQDDPTCRFPRNLPPRIWREILAHQEPKTIETAIRPLLAIWARAIVEQRLSEIDINTE